MRISRAGKPNNQPGFSYAMVLAAVVIVGIVIEAARVTTWRIVRKAYSCALSRPGKPGPKAGVEGHSSRRRRYFRRSQRKHGRAAQAGEFSEGVRKVYGCEILFGVGVRIHAGPGFQAAERRRGEDGSTGGLHAKRV